MNIRQLYIAILITLSTIIVAQENHYSQFYNSPQYVNPAFAGDSWYMKTGGATRIMKPFAGQRIINTLLHFDYKLLNQHSGLGATFYHHTEQLAHTKVQFNYSYTIRMKNNAWAKAGVGLSMNQTGSNATTLKYPDQYDVYGYTGLPTAETSLRDNSYFPGLSAGVILYNKIIWMSFSGDYLNLPTENFAGQKTTYPVKIVVMTGMLYPVNKRTSRRRFSKFGGLVPYSSIGPVFSYITQGKYIEISAGTAFHIQPVFGGVHYRYQHDFRINDNKYAYRAIALLGGYRQEEFSVTYSYDISLSNYSVNRNGAHEFAVIYYFSTQKEDYKKHALVPLPNQMLY